MLSASGDLTLPRICNYDGPQGAVLVVAGIVGGGQEHQLGRGIRHRNLGRRGIHILGTHIFQIEPGHTAFGKDKGRIVGGEGNGEIGAAAGFHQLVGRCLDGGGRIAAEPDPVGGGNPELRKDHFIKAQGPQFLGNLDQPVDAQCLWYCCNCSW